MLGPFRIRNLRQPVSPAGAQQPSRMRRRSLSELGMMVSVEGSEYAKVASRCPEARLRYLDDDDGVVVTVGDEVELAQRLEESIPRPRPWHSRSQSRLVRTGPSDEAGLPSRPLTPDVHVFEIDRSKASLEIWEAIERKTREMQAVVEPEKKSAAKEDEKKLDPTFETGLEYHRRTRENVDPQARESQLFVSMRHSPRDLRQYQFEASDPPQIPASTKPEASKTARQGTGMRLSDVLNDVEPETLAKESTPLLASFHEGNLTAEGKRQAMEAGKKLGKHAMGPTSFGRQPGNYIDSDAANRWASYSHAVTSTPFEGREILSTKKPQVDENVSKDAAKPDEVKGSLLETFRAELAKIANRGDVIAPKPETSTTPAVLVSESPVPSFAVHHTDPVVDPVVPKSEEAPGPSSIIKPKDPVEVTMQKLILQATSSIFSIVESLDTQIQHHVLPSVLEWPGDRSEGHLLHRESLTIFCREFSTKVKRANDLLDVEYLSSTESSKTEEALDHALKALKLLGSSVDALGYDLIDDCRLSREFPASPPSAPSPKESTKPKSVYHPGMYDPTPVISSPPRNSYGPEGGEAGKSAESDVGARTLRPAQKNQGTKPELLRTRSVRFKDIPTQPRNIPWNFDRSMLVEPLISYRHVPSPMPLDSPSHARGRQSELSSDSVQYGAHPSQWYPASSLLHKRRSMPALDIRRRSRSRSRSPVKTTLRVDHGHAHSHLPTLLPKPLSIHTGVTSPIRQPRQPETASRPADEFVGRSVGFDNGPKPIEVCYVRPPPPRPRRSSFDGLTAVQSSEPSSVAPQEERARHVPLRGARSQGREDARSTPKSFGWQQGAAVAGTSLRHAKSTGAIRRPVSFHGSAINDGRRPNGDGLARAYDREKITQDSVETKRRSHETDLPGQPPEVRHSLPASSTGWPSPGSVTSTAAASRFPTLEQFEGRDTTNPPRFPPLPTMKPLVPLRASATKNDAKQPESRSNEPESAKAQDSKPTIIIPGAWPQAWNESQPTESSGEFFRRVTGLDDPDSKPVSPVSPISPVYAEPTTTGARLVKPFDPIEETASMHRMPPFAGVRRSATVSALKDRYKSEDHSTSNRAARRGDSRRPYSAYFDGSGRVEWDSFLRGPDHGSAAIAREMTAADIVGIQPLRRAKSTGTRDGSSSQPRVPDSEWQTNLQRARAFQMWMETRHMYLDDLIRERQATTSLPTKAVEAQVAKELLDADHNVGYTESIEEFEARMARKYTMSNYTNKKIATFDDSTTRKSGKPAATETTSEVRRSTPQLSRVETEPAHHDPGTVSVVQECVEQLKKLGFCNEAEGGVSRLVVYAQAAQGDLWEAIEMADEDRKANRAGTS